MGLDYFKNKQLFQVEIMCGQVEVGRNHLNFCKNYKPRIAGKFRGVFYTNLRLSFLFKRA